MQKCLECVQVVIPSVKAIHVLTVESVLSGIRGTSVIAPILHSVAGTAVEVCISLFTRAVESMHYRKKCSERRKHCALVVVRWSQKISTHRRPLPGGAGRPEFNQLELVTTFTYKPSLVRIDARNFELSW